MSNGRLMKKRQIHVCGFNAHSQLDRPPSNSSDNHPASFTLLYESSGLLKIHLAKWAYTILQIDEKLIVYGLDAIYEVDTTIQVEFKQFFGTDIEPLGSISQEGRIFLFDLNNDRYSLVEINGFNSPENYIISQIAITSADRLALILTNIHNSQSTILEFQNISDFTNYLATSRPDQAIITHSLPAKITHLVAGATSFTAFTTNGEVYTWGDARFRDYLARCDGAAEVPGKVEYLAGLHVTKVVGNGGIFGAMTDDGDAYVWGRPERLEARVMRNDEDMKEEGGWWKELVQGEGSGEVTLVQEMEDVADLAVARSGIVLVSSTGRVKVIGENGYGQLGIEGRNVVGTWTDGEVDGVVGVVCGPISTFFVREASQLEQTLKN